MNDNLQSRRARLEVAATEEETLVGTTSTPDPCTYECFKLTKVYDWVKLTSDLVTPVLIPSSDLQAIEDAIAAGDTVVSTGVIPLDEIVISIIRLTRDVDSAGKPLDCVCAVIQKLINANITITDTTTGVVLSQFTKTSQIFDSTKLCLPLPLAKDNIIIKPTESEVLVLSLAPLDGVITAEFSICQDIKVELDVIAKLDVKKYCPSRKGVPCLGSVTCAAGCGENPPVAACNSCGAGFVPGGCC